MMAIIRWIAYGLCALFLVAQPSVVPLTAAGNDCQGAQPPTTRFGINVAREEGKEITDYAVEQIHTGWYLDYTWREQPFRPNGMVYLPMLRRWHTDAAWQAKLAAAVTATPGATWILGNEPDNREQDNRTPDDYARFYHTAYTFIKTHDPTSHIAIAAITQPTPLRLRYLDFVLRAYQRRFGTKLPVDLWTVHGYIFPETGPWGIGVPPGMAAFAKEGKSYTAADHDNLAIFSTQLRAFRRWMATRGYGDKALILSEFGILLPPDYGYTNKKVVNFMHQSFAWLQSATDTAIGYAADGDQLVQKWAWFSLNYYTYDPTTGIGHNGNLFEHSTGQLTPIGRAFAAYTSKLLHSCPATPQ
jgi:hypothetical protein